MSLTENFALEIYPAFLIGFSLMRFLQLFLRHRRVGEYFFFNNCQLNEHKINSDQFTDKRRVLNMSPLFELSVPNSDVPVLNQIQGTNVNKAEVPPKLLKTIHDNHLI